MTDEELTILAQGLTEWADKSRAAAAHPEDPNAQYQYLAFCITNMPEQTRAYLKAHNIQQVLKDGASTSGLALTLQGIRNEILTLFFAQHPEFAEGLTS